MVMTEDISSFLNQKSVEIVFFDYDGNIETKETKKTCAYAITTNGKENYYAKFLRGSLFDPQGIDATKINSLTTEFKKVAKNTFGFYVDYLESKKRNRLTWAERSNIDV
tara:strand:+ start:213 stop:539 length:327 start_codon:yes stop_codon:yes gene_type:complete